MSNEDGRVPSEPGSREPDPQAVPALSGFDPSRGDYSVLDMADLHYAARILEGMALEVARTGAGREMAEKVDLAAQAVRLAIEVLDDLHATVRARDSGAGE